MSDSEDDFEEPIKLAESRLPLTPDTYGFFLFASFQCFDRSQRKRNDAAISVFVLGTFLHIVALAAQGAMTFALLEFSVERQADQFQRIDILAKAPEVDAAAASGVALESTDLNDEVLGLCRAEHHVPYFQSLVIFIWCVKLLPPLVQSIRFTMLSFSLPDEPAHTPMVSIDNEKFLITCMPTWMRLFVLFCDNLPRCVMQVYLGWMGAQYLMFASSLNVLITKAVGLIFIREMSTLIFQGFASQGEQDQMSKVYLCYHKEDPNAVRKWWDHWGALLVKFGGLLVGVLWFCRIYHGDVQNFRDACFRYHYAIDVPACEALGCGTTFLGVQLSN